MPRLKVNARPESLDPQARWLLDSVAKARHPDFADLSPADVRVAFDQSVSLLGGTAEEVAAREERFFLGPKGPLRMWFYRPQAFVSGQRLPALLWIHGGGFIFGSLESYDRLVRALANRSRCVVVAVDYRLAPEHQFPSGLNDCKAAWSWLHEKAEAFGLDAQRLAIGGDSAGATLAAVVTLLAQRGEVPRPEFQLLVYPGTAPDASSPSHQRFGSGYLLTRRTIEWCYRHYLGSDYARNDFRFAPLLASHLCGLPSCCVVVAGHDPLRDEGIAYAARMADAGVPVELLEFPSMIHGFLLYRGVLDVAEQGLDTLGRVLHTALASRKWIL